MKCLYGAALAAMLWGIAASAANAAECETRYPLTLSTLTISSRYTQLAVGLEHGYFAKHCVELEVKPTRDPSVARDQLFHGTVDGTFTLEPALEAYLAAAHGTWKGSELPVIYAAASGENWAIVGRLPVTKLAGQVMATSRCPDVEEHADGTRWSDVTDAADEQYVNEPPSSNTMMKFALIRDAIKQGVLPADTRLICGYGFTDGFRPAGESAVYVEAGHNSSRRRELLQAGTVAATSVQIDSIPQLRRSMPDLIVYPDTLGRRDILAGALYAFPSKFEEKRAAFCGMNRAFAEINADLLAGTVADKPANALTIDDLDADAKRAFGLFNDVVEYDGIQNLLIGALTIKRADGPGTDEVATQQARLETFATLRQEVVRPSVAVTDEELARYAAIFGFDPKVSAYHDPCL